MFSALAPPPVDAIIALMGQFKADPRTDIKVDLGVGVYKDETGNTPIMAAVKTAEHQLWQLQNTKTYTTLIGDVDYVAAMRKLVLGDSVDSDRVAGAATPGGTGAIHNLFELIKMVNTGATVWISNPSWGNHKAIANYVGVPNKSYRYFDDATCAVDFEGMLADLDQISTGDVVLLHGCCHNPTGANLNNSQWQQVGEILLAKGAIPLIDIAYQGFGDGLDADAYGLRALAGMMPEMMIAASCSKNFGLYRERTGIMMAITQDAAQAKVVQGNMASINRLNFSFPPDHGAKLVAMILDDDELRQNWTTELESMRISMLDTRKALTAALQAASNSNRFGFISDHRGMFSRIGASPEQVNRLRDEFAIYMVADSRINIAGVTKDKVDYIAQSIIAVGA